MYKVRNNIIVIKFTQCRKPQYVRSIVVNIGRKRSHVHNREVILKLLNSHNAQIHDMLY